MAFSSWSKHRQTCGALRQRSRACRHVLMRDVISLSRLRKTNKTVKTRRWRGTDLGGERGSPEHVHGVLLPRRWGEGSKSHHLGRVPERLLQVAPLNVALQVGQTQHSQVQRVRGDARQARPLLLCANDPVVVRVGVVLVVLQVIAREVGVRYCVGLKQRGGGWNLSHRVLKGQRWSCNKIHRKHLQSYLSTIYAGFRTDLKFCDWRLCAGFSLGYSPLGQSLGRQEKKKRYLASCANTQ